MKNKYIQTITAQIATIMLVQTLGVMPALAQGEVELVAVVPPTGGIAPEYVDAIQVRDDITNEVVFVTRNLGSGCGGGTPASAWKLILDPETGEVISMELKQHLSQIQSIRGALFESSDGTLFTGGGWCGPKPPYVSFDGGESYRPATVGDHPPNSTFCYAEFQGEVYAGTGYEPYPAQIYRWLGDGTNDWQLVWTSPYPSRSIPLAMKTYQNQLFVGTVIYGASCVCEGTVPVHVSSDGVTFNPTTGIPSCHSVYDLLVVSDQLIARTADCNTGEMFIYHWNTSSSSWEQTAPYDLEATLPHFVTHGGAIYSYGQAPDDPYAGIYRSKDFGQTWEQIGVLDYPIVTALHMYNGALYIGTRRDGSNDVYIYRLLTNEAYLDIKPGSCPNPVNRKSRGVLPVALVGTEDFDVRGVDLASILLSRADGMGGSVAPLEGLRGPHSVFEDVATPFDGEPCDCHTLGSDGIIDLSMKFRTQDVVKVLELDLLNRGDVIELVIEGTLHNNTPFTATDCIVITGKVQ